MISLAIQHKELGSKIRKLKAELKEYTDLENMNDMTWQCDNGYVEVATTTKYKLADIPSDFKVPSEIAAIDIAEKAFKCKISLSKEGKQMFREQYPAIVNLMIPSSKKNIKVII